MKSVVQEASSIAKAIELGLTKADNPKDFSVKILEYPERNFFGITTKSARIALYWDDKASAKSNEPHPIPTLDRASGAGREFRERHSEQRSGERAPRYENRREDGRRDENRREENRREQAAPRSEYRERRDTRENTPREPREVREPRVRDTREVRETRENREPRVAPEVREKIVPVAQPVAAPEDMMRAEEQRVPLWNAEIIAHMEQWLRRVLNGLHKDDVTFSMEQQEFCVRIMLSQRLSEDFDQERKILASLSLLLLETSRHLFKVNLRGHKVLLVHQSSSPVNEAHESSF